VVALSSRLSTVNTHGDLQNRSHSKLIIKVE
jgi:hypothetical protein